MKKALKFGGQVYKNRKLRGMSQKELGQIIGINSSTVCRIENGYRKDLSYKIVFKLKRALNISEPDDGFKF